MGWIVELEKGIWITRGRGGLNTTSSVHKARVYSRWQDARIGLTWAQKRKPCKDAKIVEVETLKECSIHEG